MNTVIEASDLYKIYGSGDAEVRALNGVDLQIKEGEFVVFMGSSGSGKSTCMNIIGCLDQTTSGTYHFHGVDVSTLDNNALALLRRNYIGFIFQSFNLLARTSAQDNVKLPLVYKGIPRKDRDAMALKALERVGMTERADHTPAQLSGGQQQRVAIARALVTWPSLLLADEPTGNLDSARSIELMELLQRLNKEEGLTIIMVTHEPETARFASRILIFHDGKIIKDGTPEEVL